jgi:hypothetical protein
MSVGLQIARAVAKELDNDDVYGRAQSLGSQAVGLRRAQISGLESVANGTRKVSDVLDYIKLRTARHKEWRVNEIGAALLAALERDLRERRDGICKELEQLGAVGGAIKMDDYMRQDIYIRLIRGFVAQIAAQYEFASLQQGRASANERD